MIIALIVLLLFSGALNAPNLDLSDPAVLVEFKQEISTIVTDPAKAAKVSGAIYHLNIMSYKTRSAEGSIDEEIRDFYSIAGNYNATSAQVHAAMRNLEKSLNGVSQSTIDGREVIRRNTTKKEWKKLLKTLSKK